MSSINHFLNFLRNNYSYKALKHIFHLVLPIQEVCRLTIITEVPLILV